MKKFLCLMMAVFMLWSVLPFSVAAAEKKNLLQNSSFEELDDDGKPVAWTLGTWGETTLLSDDAQDGKNSIHMESESDNVIINYTVKGIVERSSYTLEAYLKANKINNAAAMQVYFYDANDTNVHTVKNNTSSTSKKFEKITVNMQAPAKAVKASILIRLNGGGDVLWDNITFTGQQDASAVEEVKEEVKEEKKAEAPKVETQDQGEDASLAGTEGYSINGLKLHRNNPNLLTNGNFEILNADGTGPADWNGYRTGWKDNIYLTHTTEGVYEGKYAVSAENTDPNENPFISQVVPVTPNTEYQISTMFRSNIENISKGYVAFKLEFYTSMDTGEDTHIVGARTGAQAGTGGKWKPYAFNFTTPAGCAAVAVYLRLYDVGDVVFDDAVLCQTETPARLSVSTRNRVHYDDQWGTDLATLEPNLLAYPELSDYTFNMRLKDGDEILYEGPKSKAVNGVVTMEYDRKYLTKMKHIYAIEGVVYNDDGSILETTTHRIFTSTRPENLTDDGRYVMDGETGNYVVAYRYRDYHYSVGTPYGINVAQIGTSSTLVGDKLIEYMRGQLDKAQAAGVKCMVCLYNHGFPAGNPMNAENTRTIVEALKDHPAVFAWSIMDEPFTANVNPHEDLFDGYVLIRSIDDKHPVIVNEATDVHQRDASLYCDMLSIDPYPSDHDEPEIFPATRMKMALEAVEYDKPVLCVLQALYYSGYFPDHDEMRNMLYQAITSGASAVGLYKFDDSYVKDDIKQDLHETTLWPTLQEFGEMELDMALDTFLHGKNPIFLDIRKDEYWALGWICDGVPYVVVLNRRPYAQNVEIPLVSYDGSVTVGDFKATIIRGGEGTVEGNGTLKLKLVESAAPLYKLETNAFGGANLPLSTLKDLTGYDWARKQIITLDAKGITNRIGVSGFGPAKQITRGDFALFLVRALGLTADAVENFADVDPAAHYAKEVAVGKALGILQGIGDNQYAPENPISRQDLMTIIARGMQLSGEGADMSGFSDTSLVAQYAYDAVCAMVKAGLVKGNADGTINPLGSTTRAEAAVIMDRIIAMNG